MTTILPFSYPSYCFDWQLSVRQSSRSVKQSKYVYKVLDVTLIKVPLPQ
jgi:hypothetical protein